MKKLVVTLIGASLAAAMMQAQAEDVGGGFDVSMNAGIVTDYLFRGISQTMGRGAIQGGLDVKHSSGAYVGTWMSSLNTGYADAEQDLYAGYGFNVTDNAAIDLHVINYTYPGNSSAQLFETHAGATLSNLATKGDGLTVGADYSSDAPKTVTSGATTGTTWNYSLAYSYPLPMDITLAATAGYFDFKAKAINLDKSDYTYWNIGVSKKLVGITWGLSYNDTNISKTDCADFAGVKDACGNEVVLSATKAL